MSGLSRLTGTPWHVERMVREEGDSRRHRSRCKFYRKHDSYCSQLVGRCMGSAHCDYYEETENPLEENQNPASTTEDELKEKSEEKQKLPNKAPERRIVCPFHVYDRILHVKYGEGYIIELTVDRIKIRFLDGQSKEFQLDFCLQKKLIKKP